MQCLLVLLRAYEHRSRLSKIHSSRARIEVICSMNEADLIKLRELTLLLDLAYLHHFEGGNRNAKSAEGTIRLEFGNFWYRKENPPAPPSPPHLEGGNRNAKPAEGTIRLEFGNFWYRKENPPVPPSGPEIEAVVIYSSVFSAARVNYFDSLNHAVGTVQSWYEMAKEHRASELG